MATRPAPWHWLGPSAERWIDKTRGRRASDSRGRVDRSELLGLLTERLLGHRLPKATPRQSTPNLPDPGSPLAARIGRGSPLPLGVPAHRLSRTERSIDRNRVSPVPQLGDDAFTPGSFHMEFVGLPLVMKARSGQGFTGQFFEINDPQDGQEGLRDNGRPTRRTTLRIGWPSRSTSVGLMLESGRLRASMALASAPTRPK